MFVGQIQIHRFSVFIKKETGLDILRLDKACRGCVYFYY